MAGRKLPLSNQSFSEMTTMRKVKYIGSWLGAVVGGILATWQLTVFAGERVDTHVVELINENAYSAVEVQVEKELTSYQKQQQFYYLGNQKTILGLELRQIDAEVSSITRGKSANELSAADQARLNQLRDDRRRVQELITQLEREQQQLR